ncbi:MAG: molybdate ABC transporter substrate-binding protein [Spirochaetia bacterium]|nr:molybdate ABC transporter substrate-binding protein [Spirochaetia bacterium]
MVMKAYYSNNNQLFLLFILLLTTFTLVSCESGKQNLQVSAAASMSEAVTQLSEAYETRNPDIQVKIHTAASGTIASQIIRGAPVDIFISASQYHMQRVFESGHTDGHAPIVLCTNSLVLVYSANIAQKDLVALDDRTRKRSKLQHLRWSNIERIGMGNPDYVPAGRYAAQLLKSEQLYSQLQDKLVFAGSVRQALAWLEAGEVDAAFLYRTDAGLVPQLSIAAEWKIIDQRPIEYPAAIIRSEEHLSEEQLNSKRTAAQDFSTFLDRIQQLQF